MPPQQAYRLLDLFDKILGFRAHRISAFGGLHVAACVAFRNIAVRPTDADPGNVDGSPQTRNTASAGGGVRIHQNA
jgi:hypothetical protein